MQELRETVSQGTEIPARHKFMVELITYSSLTRSTGGQERFMQVREPQMHPLLRALANGAEVDQNWYRARYRDVDNAIRAGDLDSAQAQYEDVKVALRAGRFENARQHFETEGLNEERLPYEGWSL